MVIFIIILVVGFFCITIASGYVVIESTATEGEKLLVGSLSIIGCLLTFSLNKHSLSRRNPNKNFHNGGIKNGKI